MHPCRRKLAGAPAGVGGRVRDASKWMARPLKAGWYDDHVGFEAQPHDSAPNALRYGVEVSVDLASWTPLNLPLLLVSGRLQVDDPTAGGSAQRFYRVVER